MNYSLSNLLTLFLSVVGLIAMILINYDLDYISLTTKLYVFFVYSLCSGLIIYYLFKVESFNFMPILPLVCLYFICCYLSAAFFGFNIFTSHDHVKISDISFAIDVLVLGIIFLIIGYFTCKIIFRKFERKEFKILSFSHTEMFYFGLSISLMAIIFFYLIEIQNILSFTAQIKFVFIFLSFGIFTNYLFHSKSFYKKKNFIIIFYKLSIVLMEILSGSFALSFILIFLDYVYYSYLNKKLNVLPVLLFFITFFVIHEGKYEFRNYILGIDKRLYKIFPSENLLIKTHSFYKVYENFYDTQFKFENFIDGYNETHRRIYHSLESLVIVATKTPNEIDYWNGYSYKILASKLIPRLFWKEKPSDILGNEFGRRYKVLHRNDKSTSWNMPVLNEFYVNFGIKGVIIGMFWVGFLFGFLAKFFSIRNLKNVEGVIAFYFFIPLFFLESHLSLIFGAVLQSYIFSLIISIFFIFFFRRLKLDSFLK